MAMENNKNVIKIGEIAAVTKLAGFEHTKYIQGNCMHSKVNKDDIPLFIGKTIRSGRIDCNFDWYISRNISNKLERSKLNKKCLVLPYVGSVGDLAIFDGTYLAHLGSNVSKIELYDSSKFIYEYIYYFLLSPLGQKRLLRDIQGAIQKNITMEAIRNVEVPNIDLREQQKIVNVIKPIDDKIDLNNKCILKLEQMMKDIYDYWFVQFDFPNEKGKPYKSSGGKMVYNEKLKRKIPEIFGLKTVEDFCDIFTGKKDVNKSLGNGKYKFFSCAPEFRYSNEYLYDGKAILVSGNGSYTGRTIFVNDKFDLYQRTYAIVNKDDTQDIIEYIYLSLKTYFVLKVKGGTHGSAIPYIVYNDIANEPILYNKEIIMKFIDIVKQLLQKIVAIKNQNDKLKEYKNFILPLLMNGQVEVK